MLRRLRPGGYLTSRLDSPSSYCTELERDGATLVRAAFSSSDIVALKTEIESVYDSIQADARGANKSREIAEDFRYEMFNRSSLAQRIVSRREILDVIEPLLGEDCHIIANTCWRNPPSTESRHGGGSWHIDAGPHIPLAEGQKWPDDLPHPVFAIGVHIFLVDCPVEAGPTAVIPGSHKSGRPPPRDGHMDVDLQWNGIGARILEAQAGDVAFLYLTFGTDECHPRKPTTGDSFFKFTMLAEILRNASNRHQS